MLDLIAPARFSCAPHGDLLCRDLIFEPVAGLSGLTKQNASKIAHLGASATSALTFFVSSANDSRTSWL
jgi:hypothetical protein